MLHDKGEGISCNMRPRRSFGALRRLPSKRWQASYMGPDLQRHSAPSTFETRMDAEAWLAAERQLVDDARWLSPQARQREIQREQAAGVTLERYASEWLATQDLRPLTRVDYGSLLRNHILPELGPVRLTDLSRATVRTWYSTLPSDRPRARSKAIQLLHTLLNYAVDDDVIETNPASLGRRTAGRTKRAKRIRPLTVDQVEAIADAMPARLRVAVLLGCWCALRYGELAELRRGDIDLVHDTLRVERAVIRVKGAYLPAPPKTDAGIRDVHIPPFLMPDVVDHLARYVGRSKEALLFPADSGEHLHSSSFARFFARAADLAGRPDATPHYLRHTGASLATTAGATTADVMARLGHTTPSMAMVYQHSLSGADAKVAHALSRLRDESTEQ